MKGMKGVRFGFTLLLLSLILVLVQGASAESELHDHDLIWHEAKAPSCTEIGWDEYVSCSQCDYSTYEEKAALGHKLVAHEAKAATCTERGNSAYWTCVQCEKYFILEKKENENEIQETEIKEDSWIIEVNPSAHPDDCIVVDEAAAATCEGTGLTEGLHCSACGTVLIPQEIIPAKGHLPAEAFPALAPTCTEPGFTDQWVCSECGVILVAQEMIPATGHQETISYANILNVRYDCVNCGEYHWEWNQYSRNMISGLVKNSSGEDLDYVSRAATKYGKFVLTLAPENAELKDGICLYLTRDQMIDWMRQGLQSVDLMAGEYLLNVDLAKISLPEGTDGMVFTVKPDGVQVERASSAGGLWETMELLLSHNAQEAESGRSVSLIHQDDDASEEFWNEIDLMMKEAGEE